MENLIDVQNFLETIIGFEKRPIYDLMPSFSKEGYIGAYEYDSIDGSYLLHLYNDKISLFKYDANTSKGKLSFQRLPFSESISKLIILFPKELRKYKIEKFLKNNL